MLDVDLHSSHDVAEGGVSALTQIKVIGVGGGGNNAVNRMIEGDNQSIDFIAVNTDAQSLVRSLAGTRLRIGDKLTRGLGVGGNHSMGMLAAEESRDDLARAVAGADMVFVTAGMGGGTGTGAAPVVAEVAKDLGILTIAVVTRPFNFEGTHRAKVAADGIVRLKERADCLIVIPNEKLLAMCDANVSIEAAFRMVDDVLFQSVNSISEVITGTGNINLDFNDVKATMVDGGHGWISVGHGRGKDRAVDAARAAIVSPLFDYALDRAKRILFNIAYNDMSLTEVSQAAEVVKKVADPGAQIIFGLTTEPAMGSDVKLTLIATGFGESERDSVGDHPGPPAEDVPWNGPETGRRRVLPWMRHPTPR